MFRNVSLPFLVFVLSIASCTPNAIVLPTSIPTVSESPSTFEVMQFTSTPEVTATPSESVEERAERLGEEAGLNGEKANDYSLWSNVELKGIFEDPAQATDEQLIELDAYVTGMRRSDFKLYLKRESEKARLNLWHVFTGFSQDSPRAEAVKTMSVEDLQVLISEFSREELLYLEVIRRANNKENILLSPIEIIEINTDPDSNIRYSENMNDMAQVIGSGRYGKWMKDSFHEDFIQDKVRISIRMFDRDTFNGKEIMFPGVWFGDNDSYDFVGVVDLPYEKTAILGLLKDAQGNPFLKIIEVVLADQAPVKVEFYPECSGGWAECADWNVGGLGWTATKRPPSVELTTRGSEGTPRFKSDLFPLTHEKLQEYVEWPPNRILVFLPNEHAVDNDGHNMIQGTFFDPLTGLPILGSTKEANDFGVQVSIAFYEKKNPWPEP